ncbi:MAG TPA: BTAD domain-containing putative transcriptional regulator, partial [Gemmatimonadales bacterium]
MRIQTLGGLSAHSAEGLLSGEAAQPRRLALLALLARVGDRGISRDRLVGYLWPEADEDRARRSLSQALYSLRQGLRSEELFLGTQELRLNPALVTSDLAEFDSTRREGNWGRAAELYTGPFLDGFHLPGTSEFERWAEAERQTLNNEYAELLERLAVQADRSGEYRSAVGWWRKLAALDPLNARIALALMRSQVAAGDRTAALRHARVYQALVEQELDLPADREVLALAERIRTQPVDPVEPVSPPIREPLAGPALPVPLQVPPAPEPVPGMAEAPSRAPVRRAYLTGIVLLPVVVLLALWAWSSRDRGGPVALPAETPLLMVGRIADYGGAPNGGLGRPLADMIGTDLARAPRLKVISTARVYGILAQLRVSDTVSAALMSAARHAGATELLDGALFDLGGGRIRLDLRRVDVATGSVLGAYSVQGSDPFGLADSATVLLVADLGTTAPGGLIADLTTRSLDAYRAYDAGLQDYFRRSFAAAERHFADALRADSRFAMASFYYAVASEDGAERIARLNHALRLAAHASDRERLIISAYWALANAAPSTRALAETLAVRYPAEVDAHLFLGHALYMQEDFLGGIRSFARVIAMDSLGLRGGGARCAACDAYSNLIAGYATVDSFSAALAAARAWGAAQPR